MAPVAGQLLLTDQYRVEIGAQPEWRLLLACASECWDSTQQSTIRQILQEEIDWTAFVRTAVSHNVASLVGSTLARTVPESVPENMLDAFRRTAEYTHLKNSTALEELSRIIRALSDAGIETITFNGPVLGARAYAAQNLRIYSEPNFLVRDSDVAAAIAALYELGYHRQKQLTTGQLDFIRYLQGRETLQNRKPDMGVHICTRVTPIQLMPAIDHEGLWQRATAMPLSGHSVVTFSPEDELFVLAISNRLDQSIRLDWVCDIAGMITSHRGLDWPAIIKRARDQACLRTVLLAVSLARTFLGARVPDNIVTAARTDPVTNKMVLRAVRNANELRGTRIDDNFSLDLLRLQDGFTGRADYLVRALFLPLPAHVRRISLPARLNTLPVYIALRFAQDAAMLPLLRAYRKLLGQARHLRHALIVSPEQRLRLKRQNQLRIEAERALAVNPGNLTAWQNLGDALCALQRPEAAIACYDKALEISPEDSSLWTRRGAAVRACGKQPDEFGIQEDETLDRDNADAWARRAAFFAHSKRYAEAVAAADQALAINPHQLVAMRVAIRSRILACDWRRREEDERRVSEGLAAGVNIITPAGNRAISDSEAQNLLAARLWIQPMLSMPRISPRNADRHDRIRIAYLCSDYRDGHPGGRGIVEVLEKHDRTRFDTAAISLGTPNSGDVQRRVKTACDRFIDANNVNDQQVSAMIRDMEIDIAVDIDRLAGRARPGILAQRPAALQLTYFGNAGTTGAPFFDYIIADATLIPRQHFCQYTEQVIWLPNSYQCNDSRRTISELPSSRVEAGLPEGGFVYCCFNNNYKICPQIFDVWMRLLRAVPGSVLWLLSGGPYANHNLRREAAVRSVAPERIVFAPKLPYQNHLGRHRLADLFLDTIPCNAHATASDALWAGLPMVTCLGNTFAGRVGASLLRAVGLPEMVTESLTEYEELALALARDPQRLAAITAKLARNRDTEALFDSARLTRDLEAAYAAIWHRQQSGLPPAAIAV